MKKTSLLLVVAALIVGGLVVWKVQQKNSDNKTAMTPTPSAQISATVSPSATVKPRPSTSPTPTPTASNGLIIHVQKIYSVLLKNFAFSPANLTVQSGDVVVFKNRDSVDHTITADNGAFDSGVITAGSDWNLTTATLAPGAYTIHCTLHPSMQATLIVQ